MNLNVSHTIHRAKVSDPADKTEQHVVYGNAFVSGVSRTSISPAPFEDDGVVMTFPQRVRSTLDDDCTKMIKLTLMIAHHCALLVLFLPFSSSWMR